MRGKLLVFEGIDGSGKSLRADVAAECLGQAGKDVLSLTEPDKGPLGKGIRSILEAGQGYDVDTQILLFTANRRFIYKTIIEPALEKGTYVVLDRTWISTIAYQGYGGQHGESVFLDKIDRITQEFIDVNLIDLCIICDVDIDVAQERMISCNKKLDVFERKGKEYFSRVREGYLNIPDRYKFECVILGTTNTPNDEEIIKAEIYDILKMKKIL